MVDNLLLGPILDQVKPFPGFNRPALDFSSIIDPVPVCIGSPDICSKVKLLQITQTISVEILSGIGTVFRIQTVDPFPEIVDSIPIRIEKRPRRFLFLIIIVDRLVTFNRII